MGQETTRCGTVVLFGPPNAGKSSLLNAIVGEKIAPTTHKPQTTRRQIRGIITQNDHQFVFVDVPGIIKSKYALQSFMRRQAMLALPEADVIVLVVDIDSDGEGEELALSELNRIKAKAPVVLALNKIDTCKKKEHVLVSIKKWSEKFVFEAIIPISAHKKDGLKELLSIIKEKLPVGPFIFAPDSFTDASEKTIVAELVREKIILELHEEIPHKVAVTIEVFDESRREHQKKPIIDISAVIHTERRSQKPILIGKKGAKIKTIGQRARKDIERLLGCKVMLRLFVRVEPDWSKQEKSFKKLGIT